MTNKPVRFGHVEKFELAIHWVDDHAPPAHRPVSHGWSMGQFELTVAGVNLTASAHGGHKQPYVGWYLGPMFDWLAASWVYLFHEERFCWPKRDSAPAAIACRRALNFWIGTKDNDGRAIYRDTQAWYWRHGLRTAAAGGLFPDLFIRRVADDIEISWSGEPPPFAPEGLSFESGAGVARLAVSDVAEPLWQALQWLKTAPPELDAASRDSWEKFCAKVDAIEHLEPQAFESAAIATELLDKVRASFGRVGETALFDEHLHDGRPFIEALSPAVAMFGGLSPQLGDRDIDALRDMLVSAKGGADSERLEALVVERNDLPVGGVPYEDGYQFAEEFLEDLEMLSGDYMPDGFVDVHAICATLDIRLEEPALQTASIRGVALAGQDFRPVIVINRSHSFNDAEDGRRFTIAHELCHILFDRTRARRISHVSGPWAPAGIEKRANAFAAYLLMPREAITRHAAGAFNDGASLRALAARLRVSETALVEHLYNLDFIDDVQRDEWRLSLRPSLNRRGSAPG